MRKSKNNHVWENSENNLLASIHKRHLDEIKRLCSKYYPNECGGILLGQYDKTLKKAYITKIYFTKENVGAPFFVELEAKKVNVVLQTLWRLTFGKHYLLGTWHSHPNGNCMPSMQDDSSMFEIARSEKCQCTRPILLICGGNLDGWRTDYVWVYTNREEKLRLDLIVS